MSLKEARINQSSTGSGMITTSPVATQLHLLLKKRKVVLCQHRCCHESRPAHAGGVETACQQRFRPACQRNEFSRFYKKGDPQLQSPNPLCGTMMLSQTSNTDGI